MIQSNKCGTDLLTTTTNHEYVGKALMLLKEGLRPFVERQIAAAFPNDLPIDTARRRYMLHLNVLTGDSIQEWDVQALLVLMRKAWSDAFQERLGFVERSYVSELTEARNFWAHQNPFSAADAFRDLDTTLRLLRAIEAPGVCAVESMRDVLLQRLVDEKGTKAGRTDALSQGRKKPILLDPLDREKKNGSSEEKPSESNSYWGDIAKRFPPGIIIEGTVCHIASSVVLVQIEPGISGRMRTSDLSWKERPSHPDDLIRNHQKINVMVLGVDEENTRIDLGYIQAKANPWDHLSTDYRKGSTHSAKVVSIQKKGIVAELPHDFVVFVLWEELRDAGRDKSSAYREGDELNLRVIGMDPDRGKLTMSERAASEDLDPEPEEPKPVSPLQPLPQKKPLVVLPRPEERVLGKCPGTGHTIFLKKDAEGYYVQLGDGYKPRRTPVHPKMMEPHEVTLDIARQLLGLPREIGIHPETLQPIRAGVGRSGPCVRMGNTCASLGRGDDLFSISQGRALDLIDAKKLTRLLGLHPRTREKVWAELGADGPYVRMGNTFASLEGRDALSAMTLEWAVELIDATSRWF